LGRVTGRESHAKTPYEMLFIQRFTKVTHDPVLQGAGPVNVIWVGSDKDCWVGSDKDCRNRVPCIDKVSVEFDPSHHRHVDSRRSRP
jgi:hypothetical protein